MNKINQITIIENTINIKTNEHRKLFRRNLASRTMTLSKNDRIESKKSEIGNRHTRKIKTYSNGFNSIFYFFLKSYLKNILTFPGEEVYTEFSKDGPDCKEAFRLYENGDTKNVSYNSLGQKIYHCRHNNILKALIISKKSWGLQKDMWTDGIAEECFTKYEILFQFEIENIIIPEPFLLDFNNAMWKKRFGYEEKYGKSDLKINLYKRN